MTDCMEITVNSPEETFGIGEALGRALEPGSVVALTGELGAGKTVIAKGIARGVGIEEEPTSPTFVIMNVYEGGEGGEGKALRRGVKRLYHFDLYRISWIEELEEIGYEDYFFDDEAVVVVEWAERVKGIFPPSAIRIEIEIPKGGDKKRGDKGAGNREKGSDVEDDSGGGDNRTAGSAEIGIITKRTIKITGEEDWLLSFKSMVERA